MLIQLFWSKPFRIINFIYRTALLSSIIYQTSKQEKVGINKLKKVDFPELVKYNLKWETRYPWYLGISWVVCLVYILVRIFSYFFEMTNVHITDVFKIFETRLNELSDFYALHNIRALACSSKFFYESL